MILHDNANLGFIFRDANGDASSKNGAKLISGDGSNGQ